jgi:hypothetical protein
MTTTTVDNRETRTVERTTLTRPVLGWAGKITLVFLGLLAIGAIGGAAFMLAKPDGSLMQFSPEMLAGSPFPDFLVPGLILGGVFGIGSCVVIALGLRGALMAPFLAFAIGFGQMAWIVVELAIIGEFSFLHPTMFAVGLVIALASVPWGWPTFESWRAARSPRGGGPATTR